MSPGWAKARIPNRRQCLEFARSIRQNSRKPNPVKQNGSPESAQSESSARRRIAVVGGGIAGLAAAHRVTELDPAAEVLLFEAADRLGGVIETFREGPYLVEAGADNFITDVPWAIDLCRRLGIEDQLLRTNDQFRRAAVVHRGRLQPIPEGFLIMAPSKVWPVLSTPILSLWGKLRLAAEYFVPRRANAEEDESLGSFARRRFGRETFERLIQPLVGGIYTADAEQLSLKATLPRFLDMEAEHGSLIRASRKKSNAEKTKADQASSGSRYSMFVALRDGLDGLARAIAERLPRGTVRLNSPVESIEPREGQQWAVSIAGENPTQFTVDGVVVATPAHVAARQVAPALKELSGLLNQILYAGAAVIALGFRRDQISHPLNGFGFVVPLVERRKILSASFSSIKYDGRAPEDHVLVRVFIGGACQGEYLELEDDALIDIATAELSELIGLQGEPVISRVCRYHRAMPQYHLGHLQLVDTIDAQVAKHPGLALAGNAYRGVGIPHCVHSGELAAERVLAELKQQASTR